MNLLAVQVNVPKPSAVSCGRRRVRRLQSEWIAYRLDVSRFELGISMTRAHRASPWLADKATEGRVKLGELREGLGRLRSVTGAIEFLRPCLGLLYAWAPAGPRHARPKLPVMVVPIMRYLSTELAEVRAMPCQRRANFFGEVFRLDAKAEDDTAAVGGCRSTNGAKASEAAWYSVSLTRSTASWAFVRG